ncbi:MAG: hypothetical protein KBT12_01310 [Bacteroidales bacterium]|nr:hypothetical protein [Candidatus Physcousia equi]
MSQIAILNYETASVEIITLSEATIQRYANDYDKLVYGAMGYKRSAVYYMIADKINICEADEETRIKRDKTMPSVPQGIKIEEQNI